MQNKTKTATVETAYGKKLAEPLAFDFTFTVYESGAELQQAGDIMSLDEQVKTRNTQRENKARQQAQSAAFDAAGIVKPTAENDEQVRLKDLHKTLMLSKKYTDEQARKMASDLLGVEWAE